MTAVAGLAMTWLLPGLALACTVCMGGQEEESRKAFVGTTAFMTFLPLGMLAIGVGLFVRRALAHEREQEEALGLRRDSADSAGGANERIRAIR